MSEKAYTAIENYLHNLHFAKGKREVLQSVTSKSARHKPHGMLTADATTLALAPPQRT